MKKYASVVDMLQDIDPEMASTLEESLQKRVIITHITNMRHEKGLTIKDVAKATGWSENKCMKFEDKIDNNIKLGELAIYLEAMNKPVTISIDDQPFHMVATKQ